MMSRAGSQICTAVYLQDMNEVFASAVNGLWSEQVVLPAKDARVFCMKQGFGTPNNNHNNVWSANVFNELDKDKCCDKKGPQFFALSLGESWSKETLKQVFEMLDTDMRK